ncbi:hypothetical protein EMIT0P44_40014 [Pseudomonas sp. IT-P44]
MFDRRPLCRSRLAGDGFEDAAFIQELRVIVNDHHRNAARSKPAPTEYGQSLVALFITKNAMLRHSLFLKAGKSWIVYKQCAYSSRWSTSAASRPPPITWTCRGRWFRGIWRNWKTGSARA